jgi:hypothetical protein
MDNLFGRVVDLLEKPVRSPESLELATELGASPRVEPLHSFAKHGILLLLQDDIIHVIGLFLAPVGQYGPYYGNLPFQIKNGDTRETVHAKIGFDPVAANRARNGKRTKLSEEYRFEGYKLVLDFGIDNYLIRVAVCKSESKKAPKPLVRRRFRG